jgi:hypothetical protein
MGFGRPDTPGEVLVLDELQRIEQSEEFRNSTQYSQMLRMIVEGTLKGKVPTSKELASAILSPYAFSKDPQGLQMRVQANTVRTKLAKYYGGIGKRELVVIKVPKGAYRAEFRYNERAGATLYMARADAHARVLDFEQDGGSIGELLKAIASERNLTIAYTTLAEHCLMLSIMRRITAVMHREKENDELFLEALALAEKQAPDECKTFLVSGAWLALHRRWELAAQAFDYAREIDPVQTEGSLWLALYVMLLGDVKKAVEISAANVENGPGRDDLLLAHAFFLYMARSFDEARQTLWGKVTASGGEGVSQVRAILGGFVALAKEDYAVASTRFAGASRASLAEFMQYTDSGERKGWPERYVGLVMFCSIQGRDAKEGLEWAKKLDEISHVHPFQRMFLHAAAGDGKQAITALRASCLQGDLISCALHLWPFLDPYRDNPRFARLLERLNLPPNVNKP